MRAVGLAAADDSAVWAYARQHDRIIVSKDSDFSSRAFLYGAPPKVIWVALGNAPTDDVEELLRRRQTEIETFASGEDATLLVIK